MTYNSFLSLDIGSQHTRAWFFNNASGYYQLVERSETQTTLTAGGNLMDGVLRVCEQLQKKTEHQLLDHNGKFMVGGELPGLGVRKVSVSLSAGPRIRTALIGLTGKTSLASIRRLANLFYTDEVTKLTLSEGLDPTHQLESLMNANAELIIIAGGDNEGAKNPIMAAVENVRLVYAQFPSISKPQIVYTGNQSLKEEIVEQLEAGEDLHIAPNITPEFGEEDLSSAWGVMLDAFERIRLNQLPGLQELKNQTGCRVLPTAFALGRMVRYLDQTNKSGKGVMALDVGAGSTMLVASRSEKFTASLTHTPIEGDTGEKTCKYSSFPLDVESVAVYMQNKSLHPSFMASTLEDLAIEHAWTRVRLQDAMVNTKKLFNSFRYDPDIGLTDSFEPIILSGESLTNVPSAGQLFLIVLDGLKSHGITTFVLDKDQILASLGTLAEVEPLLPVQVLMNGVFTNLGTVICADSPAKEGQLILSIEISREEVETREIHELRKGDIKRYEVKPNSKARFYLAPEIETDTGMGHEGLGGWVSVTGSELGVIVDARGRPFNLPDAKVARSETIRNWLWELGG